MHLWVAQGPPEWGSNEALLPSFKILESVSPSDVLYQGSESVAKQPETGADF